jgi:hypothetical protein
MAEETVRQVSPEAVKNGVNHSQSYVCYVTVNDTDCIVSAYILNVNVLVCVISECDE